jgi:hypothetical protein
VGCSTDSFFDTDVADEKAWNDIAKTIGVELLGIDGESASIYNLMELLNVLHIHTYFALVKGVVEHGKSIEGDSANSPAAHSVQWLRYFCAKRVHLFTSPVCSLPPWNLCIWDPNLFDCNTIYQKTLSVVHVAFTPADRLLCCVLFTCKCNYETA